MSIIGPLVIHHLVIAGFPRKEGIMIVYFESSMGCGLREARNLESAEKAILKEVGTYSGVSLVRKATAKDIEWVSSMGGYIPNRKD